MLTLLTGFAALSLVSGALLSLLEDGSLRQTAAMIVGLLMLLYWAGGIRDLLANLPLSTCDAPASVLSATGTGLPALTAIPEEGAP